MPLRDRWTRILDELRPRERYRTIVPPCGIDLCSNDYLGYAGGGWPARASRDAEAELERLRGATAARLVRGHHAIWDEVESELARWHGAEAALVMSSGYVANEGLLSTIVGADDWVASDRLNHASIIDGLRLSRAERFIYRHCDLDHLADGLRTAALARSLSRELFIVTESLFSMDGDTAPLGELCELAERYDAHLIVDEAHATGCFGPGGTGLVDAAQLRDRVAATVHTGGKALGVSGAYICGSATLRELLVNRCRHFIFSTALPPALGRWWREAIARVREDGNSRAALHTAATGFRRELAGHGVAASGSHYIVPVVIGPDARAQCMAERLRAAGYDIRAIRPPTVPEGTARLRISIHADHGPAMLADAAAAVARALERPGDA
jgi:8-amino-7-oxononanoate synthase